MTQRSVVRAGFIGEFRILLQSALPITMTDTVTLKMAIYDIKGSSGGFTAPPGGRPVVC